MPTKKIQSKPQKSSAKRQSARSSRGPKTNTVPANRPKLSSILFTTLLLLVVTAIGVLFYFHSKQPPAQRPTVLEDEKYYFTDSRYRKKQLRNLDDLTTAINNRRVVCLHRYSSPHSHSFSDRVVEPFLFLNDHQDVRCYEFASGMNKTFKLARIGKVEIYILPPPPPLEFRDE